MKDFFDNQRILDVIWNRKFHFVIIGIITIILSVIFSGSAFITPKYKSSARIYPTNNISSYSNESETEQMLEIVNSRDIKLRIFETFNLDKVYKIDRNNQFYMTYMMNEYNSNVTTNKTEFETVEIKVMDENPQRASDMCDSIIEFYNDKVGQMHSTKYLEIAEISGIHIKKNSAELDSISEKIQDLRDKSQIINFETQVEEVTKGYMRSLASNASHTSDGKKIKEQFDLLNKNGIVAYQLEHKFYSLTNMVDSLKILKDISIIEANKDITFCHVVEAPIPADKKTYPVRWLIVFISTFSAYFLGLLIFLFLDYSKRD